MTGFFTRSRNWGEGANIERQDLYEDTQGEDGCL